MVEGLNIFEKFSQEEILQGNDDRYRLMLTSDGYPCFFSESFQEATHSREGAALETDIYYIQGTSLLEKAKQKNVLCVLEVGFGYGLGYERTCYHLETLPDHQRPYLVYVALEKEPALIQWGKKHFKVHDGSGSSYPSLCDILETPWGFRSQSPQGCLYVIIGDARKTLRSLPEIVSISSFLKEKHFQADCLYQDAFSPKKHPQLWSVEWFRELKTYCHEDVLLSTFSGANRVRKSLLEAGWFVYQGLQFGSKRSSTRAGLQAPSDMHILEKCFHSPVAAIYDH
jgi:tRNA U34 5-methylaminomethyl-2-thiouridine-forming methyltransferase MnmC